VSVQIPPIERVKSGPNYGAMASEVWQSSG